MAHLDTEDTSHVVKGVQKPLYVYTLATIVIVALVLSGFEDGRKLLQRVGWSIDGFFGGAPHSITLPGPPGLPLVGNLTQVSCSSLMKS